MKLKVSAVQCEVGERAFESAEKLIFSSDSEIFLLPEYFSYGKELTANKSEETLRWLENISREKSAVVAGNVLRKSENVYFNSLYIYDSGELVGVQDKIHPTEGERKRGIACGKKLEVFEIRKLRVSALICADILYPELCRLAGLKEVDLVLNPVVSFRKSELPAKELRHCLYFTRAFDNAYAIVKAGGFGETFTGEMCAGRSLIATPYGIEAKYRDENSEELVSAEIDFERIREYRKVNYSLRDRNVGVLAELLKGGLEC